MSNWSPLLVIALLSLASCEDPYVNSRTWHATGAVQANLDAEVTDKADAIAGHGVPGSDATLDAAAIHRLYQDKTKPLTNESTTATVGGQ